MASRVLTGRVPAADLVVWAHSTIGHDRVALAERLVELDDVYDTLKYTDMTEQEVKAPRRGPADRRNGDSACIVIDRPLLSLGSVSIRTVLFVDARERRLDTTRILGNIAVLVGLLITLVGLATDSTPARGYLFAGMLVFIGVGLRLEAALTDRR